jgi:UPF0755 protein
MSMDQDFDRVPDAVIAKRRRPALTRVIGSLAIWSLLLVFGAAVLLGWGWSQFTAQGPLAENKVVIVPDGASRTEISKLLQDSGVISDARVMNGASVIFSTWGAHLRPGEYEFLSGSSMASVFDIISKGRVLTYKLTVPEGWTTQMALARINENDVLVGDPIELTDLSEGALIADTMVFRRGKTRQQMVEDMKAAQDKLLDEVWAKKPADSPLKSKTELLALASIVEKETGKPEERAEVAAVFLNRINAGMRLQSDPTIIYGIVGGAGKLDRPLTKADIAGVTPYNTYQIDGLPPGPIASPGRASLEAVVAPAVSKNLFFVADGTGGHAFAETLEQHNANVKKWREVERNGILLPEEATAPETATPASPETPAATGNELPAVAETPAPEAGTPPAVVDSAVEEAAKTQQASQTVPKPAETPPAETAEAKPKPATPPPLPVEKKPKPVAAAATPAAVEQVVFVPGQTVTFDGRAIPVPKLKVKKP